MAQTVGRKGLVDLAVVTPYVILGGLLGRDHMGLADLVLGGCRPSSSHAH